MEGSFRRDSSGRRIRSMAAGRLSVRKEIGRRQPDVQHYDLCDVRSMLSRTTQFLEKHTIDDAIRACVQIYF
jgi:hypothetical protein